MGSHLSLSPVLFFFLSMCARLARLAASLHACTVNPFVAEQGQKVYNEMRAKVEV